MTSLVFVTIVAAWAAIACGGWFGYQLLRQNGRILRRLDSIEAELEQLADLSAEARSAKADGGAKAGSLAGSRLKRDGLTPGTPAPSIRLPRVDGGEFSLDPYRGHRLLLVFSSPDCAPCDQLAPKLEQAFRATKGISVAMVSRGEVEINRRKIAEHGLSFPVALQRHWEVSRAYAKFATPMAYLIDERGNIASDVAVGVEPILALLSRDRS